MRPMCANPVSMRVSAVSCSGGSCSRYASQCGGSGGCSDFLVLAFSLLISHIQAITTASRIGIYYPSLLIRKTLCAERYCSLFIVIHENNDRLISPVVVSNIGLIFTEYHSSLYSED